MPDLNDLDLETFQPLIGSGFTTALPWGAVTLVLREATAMGSGLRHGGAFSLLFSGPGPDLIGQGVLRLTNPEIGSVDLFLVPVAQSAHGVDYEAVFT
ncbi:hypothetical protein DFR52_104136 [Hoeflea marina]|uniref:DUF6916 domain-containing protein n=1 Tax=Hoeflea marina TaxID=274592 RepID=A0A317PFW3_9HYPH|nr:hypothetical protein [Hoeflea marina]PWV98846.1 hypothetical protein DFR52_104136 [Hoeflea marina]